MKVKTINDIRELAPCYDPTMYLPEDWQGTALDILRVKDCPPEDRLWVILREGWMTKNQAREFICLCVERLLPVFEKKYPHDNTLHGAIEMARAYERGDATLEQLQDAHTIAVMTWQNSDTSVKAIARATVGASLDDVWLSVWDAAQDAAMADALYIIDTNPCASMWVAVKTEALDTQIEIAIGMLERDE